MFEVEKKRIKTLFNETTSFVIPDFQRGFSWGVEEIEEFFEDLNNEQLFFIGSFILKSKQDSRVEKVEIIDGQQRTVTLALLYAALSFYFDNPISSDDVDDARLIAHELRKSIAEVDPGRPRNISRFKINFKDDIVNGFFSQILSSHAEDLPAEDDLQKRVRKAYKKILELIEQETSRDYQKLINLKERIENTEVIIITIQKDELAYQIFETVNARGVDLTVAELLKNHLFRTISDHEALKSKWANITNNLKQTQAKQLDLPTGLRFYWISNFEHTTKRRLYRAIKDAIRDGRTTESTLLNDIYAFSSDLHDLYEQNLEDWVRIFGTTSAVRRQAARWFFYKNDAARIFDKSIQYLPIFTALLKQRDLFDITSPAFRKLIHSIESVNFVYLEILGLPGNVLEKKYSEYSRKITQSSTKEEINLQVAQLCADLKGIIEKQKNSRSIVDEYISNLRYTNKRDKGIINFIFSRIEGLMVDFGVTINPANISLEHILSQNEFGRNGEARNTIAHGVGNLTLMEFAGPNGNGSLNDAPFEEKKGVYAQSPYHLTRGLCSYESWSEDAIKERTKKICDMVWEIWGPNQKISDFGL